MEVHREPTPKQLPSDPLEGKIVKTKTIMATTRRRSTGFQTPLETEEEPTFPVEITPETISEVQEEVKEEPVSAPVFIEEMIVPSEDIGPRFIEEVPELPAKVIKPVELAKKPKRHPRNVPRFSRTR